jgi:hypothetical protein
VTLRFARDQHGGTSSEVVHKEGALRVIRQPSPNSGAGPWERLKALLGGPVSV